MKTVNSTNRSHWHASPLIAIVVLCTFTLGLPDHAAADDAFQGVLREAIEKGLNPEKVVETYTAEVERLDDTAVMSGMSVADVKTVLLNRSTKNVAYTLDGKKWRVIYRDFSDTAWAQDWEETGRDEWSIYLVNREIRETLAIDLWAKFIVRRDEKGRELLGASARPFTSYPNLWQEGDDHDSFQARTVPRRSLFQDAAKRIEILRKVIDEMEPRPAR